VRFRGALQSPVGGGGGLYYGMGERGPSSNEDKGIQLVRDGVSTVARIE